MLFDPQSYIDNNPILNPLQKSDASNERPRGTTTYPIKQVPNSVNNNYSERKGNLEKE